MWQAQYFGGSRADFVAGTASAQQLREHGADFMRALWSMSALCGRHSTLEWKFGTGAALCSTTPRRVDVCRRRRRVDRKV